MFIMYMRIVSNIAPNFELRDMFWTYVRISLDFARKTQWYLRFRTYIIFLLDFARKTHGYRVISDLYNIFLKSCPVQSVFVGKV